MKRTILALALTLGIGSAGTYTVSQYEPLGFGGLGRDFGKLGAQKTKAKGGAGLSCPAADPKLDFSDGCNSMYLL